MNSLARYASGLLSILILTGLIPVAVLAQDSSSNKEAEKFLKTAAKRISEAGSYTKEIDFNFEQKQIQTNLITNVKTNTLATFDHPYIFVKTTTESGTKGGKQVPTKTQEFLGKEDKNNEYIAVYQRGAGSGGWKKMNLNLFRNHKIGFSWIQNPEKLQKQLTNVQFDGEETINGHGCRKISAEEKATYIKETVKKRVKASARKRKMLQKMIDLSVDVKGSDIDIWIRKDSSYLEKISWDTEQTIRMTMNYRGKKQTFTLKQDLQLDISYKNYESTSVPQNYKDQLEKLISDK